MVMAAATTAITDRHCRAGGEERRRDAEQGVSGSSLGTMRREIARPAVAPRHPRRGSALVVLVVAAPPVACLVAPLGGTVEPLVRSPEAVQPARIGGITVVD